MTRADWVANATHELNEVGIASARLDAELLLTHALGLSRTVLHAHPDEPIDNGTTAVLDAMLGLRLIRVPIAYIVGHREFYGRLFKVTPSVLIPRPETEDIITLIKELPDPATIIDVGTGSGALAVTLALEYPKARVYATDISRRALAVAKENATAYETDIVFLHGDLLAALPPDTDMARPAIIVANLPYVADGDDRSPETAHEPAGALFARNGGMELIGQLVAQAAGRLTGGNYLLLESNPAQQAAIAASAEENGFAVERTRHLISVLRRA